MHFLFRIVSKKRDLFTTAFKFSLEYATGQVQGNQGKLKLNPTHQFLACGDDVNYLNRNINMIKKIESLLDACREAVLGVNVEITK
jgi:hypothetical protein